jgi:anti-sigma28 factor (negative regulator of flagellin synthesis)
MIDKVALSQYTRVENKEKTEKVSVSRKPASSESVRVSDVDRVAISEQAQKAEEVARFTKMAQESPAIDEQKVAALKDAINKPQYLDHLAKNFAEKIAEKLVEALDAQYDLPKDA